MTYAAAIRLNRPTRVLGAMWLASTGFGFLEPFVPQSENGVYITLGETAVLAVMLAYWCVTDAEARGQSLPKWLLWAVALFGAFALPVHLFRSRPLGRAVLALIKAIAITGLFVASFAAAFLLTSRTLCQTAGFGAYCQTML